MFNTSYTSNGLTGNKSRNNTNSRLSALVFYIWFTSKNGRQPTQLGFNKYRGGKRNDDLFKMAKANGVIVETGARFGGSKIIAFGPNAEHVKSNHRLLTLF